LFIAATSLFLLFDNRWPIMLSLPVLAWIALYSFTKRFTALCHLFLGGALAISPLAAAIAVRPEALADTPALHWLAAMVLVWVAGFDIIYALQDIDTDKRQSLHSIPSRLGVPAAMTIARIFHVFAMAALIIAGLSDARLNLIFAIGVAIVGLLLITEHAILARRGKAGLNMAFFTINGIVSCVLGAAGVVDVVM
jgi:4-hydroxybenzoate polyprenyltransferase